MGNFTIRVHLHGPDDQHYIELNKIMSTGGFRRIISSDTGKAYQLPLGEYTFSGEIDRKGLLERVQAFAGQVGQKYSILITESKGRTWYNLTEIVKS
jgi:hypothetical protein